MIEYRAVCDMCKMEIYNINNLEGYPTPPEINTVGKYHLCTGCVKVVEDMVGDMIAKIELDKPK